MGSGAPLLAAAACALACASSRTLQRPLTRHDCDDLQRQLPSKVEVTWNEGDKVARESALDLSVPGPLAFWIRAETQEKRQAPEAALRSVEWRSRTVGAGRGALIGGLSAAALLAIAGAASGSDPPCPGPGSEVFFCFSMSAGEKAALGAVLGFIPGALIGLAVGAVHGADVKLDFAAPTPGPAPVPACAVEPSGAAAQFGEACEIAEDCRSGLTCQQGRCLGVPRQQR
jgi:hypothetical protein